MISEKEGFAKDMKLWEMWVLVARNDIAPDKKQGN